MSKNLITAGIIIPAQWPLARVWLEVAAWLGIAPRQIEHLELWPHQIWVKIIGAGAIFVSYRCLPLWIEQGLEAISECSDRDCLNQLGEIFSQEVKRYEPHYKPVAVEEWRLAWSQKAKQLRIDEERLKPLREHQQACQQWQEGWQQVLRYCRSLESLEQLASEIKAQTQEFEDLPESETVMKFWQQRKQEILQATA
ncbi:MAG: hypothetical protein AAFO04_21385 [Cyanobacteria bacterium J06592_8]